MFGNYSNAFDNLSTKLDTHSSINLISETPESYKLMNEFPSMWELDPTEAIEKKHDLWSLRDELFNNFSGINLLDELNFSIKEEFSLDTDKFSLKTDELLKDLEEKLIGDNGFQKNLIRKKNSPTN